MLACGCGVKIQDALYLYRKSYATWGDTVVVIYKSKLNAMKFEFPHDQNYSQLVHGFVVWGIVKMFELCAMSAVFGLKVRIGDPKPLWEMQNFIVMAVDMALYRASGHSGAYGERCSKCVQYLGGYNQKKCKIKDWCDITCREFEIKTEITSRLKVEYTHAAFEQERAELNKKFNTLGCQVDYAPSILPKRPPVFLFQNKDDSEDS